MSTLIAAIEPFHIPALVNGLREMGYTVQARDFEKDAFLLNHAQRLEPSDVDKQRELLDDMVGIMLNYRMFE